MTQIAASQGLVERIGALRQRVRFLLALYGIGITLAALCMGAVILGISDYFLHLSPPLRLVILLVGLVALAVLAYRKLIGPLSAKLSDRFLAGRIEHVNANLSDELTSAVDFMESGLPRKNALAAQLVASAQAHTSALNFGSALTNTLTARAFAGGLGALLLVCLIAGLNPQYAHIAWNRWTRPFAGALWPVQTNVDFNWEATGGAKPAVWPQGEPIAIRARVDRGFYSGMHVWLFSSTDTQSDPAVLMTFQSALSTKSVGIYEKIIEPVGNNMLHLRLEAGDDTEKDGIAIRLAPRPEISELQAQITPPAYVKNISDPTKPAPPVLVDLRTQAGRAVEGSTIALLIHATKPFGRLKDSNQPDVRLMDQNKEVEIPLAAMTRKLIDPMTAELSFPAAKSIQARLLVRDTDGFENHVGGTLSMEVVPDALPSITITEPRRQVERKPDGQIQITLNASDDLGLEDLFLRADNYDARTADAPAQPGAKFSTPVPWLSRTVEGGLATYTWDLSGTPLKPGDRLSLYAMVRDNYAMPIGSALPNAQSELATDESGKPMIRHKWVHSAPLTVLIFSQEQIEKDIQIGLQDVRTQIGNLLPQQTETNAKTHAIQHAAQEAGTTTPGQKQQLAELASQQAQEAQRATAIETQIKQLQETIEGNKMADTNLGKLAAEAQKGMNSVGQQDMPQAASDLSKAQDSAGKQEKDKNAAKESAQKTADHAASAESNQKQAMGTMDKLMNDLSAAGNFEKLRSDVADILKTQKELNKRNQEAATKALGQDPANLDQDLKNDLEKIANDQDQLGNKTQKVTEEMDKTAEDMQKNDPASAEAMKNAAQASKDNQVSSNQKEAGKSIQNNQTSTAANQQSQATKGLEQMMDELDQQNRKQLENLALQLRNLIDQIKAYIEKQEAIIADTDKAGRKATVDVLTPVGDQQGRLQNNVLTTAAKADTLKDGRAAALDLRDAADAMGTAAVSLLKGVQPMALPPEKDALASLQAALKRMDEQL